VDREQDCYRKTLNVVHWLNICKRVDVKWHNWQIAASELFTFRSCLPAISHTGVYHPENWPMNSA